MHATLFGASLQMFVYVSCNHKPQVLCYYLCIQFNVNTFFFYFKSLRYKKYHIKMYCSCISALIFFLLTHILHALAENVSVLLDSECFPTQIFCLQHFL